MRPVIIFLLMIATFLAGVVLKSILLKQNPEKVHDMKKPDRQLDEANIRKTENAYDLAWKHGDIDGILVCFTDDAVIVSPRSDVATGKEQIRDLLSNFLSNEASGTKHTSRITRISFIHDDVAVVDGEAFIEGSDNLSAAVKHHSFTDILVRRENGWLISQIRAFKSEEME